MLEGRCTRGGFLFFDSRVHGQPSNFPLVSSGLFFGPASKEVRQGHKEEIKDNRDLTNVMDAAVVHKRLLFSLALPGH